jgi:hypothetical protein
VCVCVVCLYGDWLGRNRVAKIPAQPELLSGPHLLAACAKIEQRRSRQFHPAAAICTIHSFSSFILHHSATVAQDDATITIVCAPTIIPHCEKR